MSSLSCVGGETLRGTMVRFPIRQGTPSRPSTRLTVANETKGVPFLNYLSFFRATATTENVRTQAAPLADLRS